MPLRLNDPRWDQLQGSYGHTADIIAWLSEAYETGGMSRERLSDLINEVQHQGGTSTAMYALAPHLIALARKAQPLEALAMLSQAGLIYAASSGPCTIPCPTFLEAEFAASAAEGAKLLAPLLPSGRDFDTFNFAVAGLAGFLGHHAFGRLLSGLDFYDAEFHHPEFDKPLKDI